MARDSRVSRSGQSQAQSTSAEPEQKNQDPQKSDEIEFFDTTISKIVTDPETGEETEVMSDHLAPGEKLKRALDEERAKEKEEQSRKTAYDAGENREQARRYQR